MKDTIYEQLAQHLSMTGLPLTDALVDIVKETFSKEEALVAMNLQPWPKPFKSQTFESIAKSADTKKINMEPSRVQFLLDQMVSKNIIYCCTTEDNQKEYALHHAGFGFPQSFFWDGSTTPAARKMTRLIIKYFKLDVTKKAFGGTKTKPYRYIPVHQSIDPVIQAVLPHDKMEMVLQNAQRFAVAHCSCRVQAGLLGRPCDHPLEVCLKFDEMATYLIDRGLGRELTRKQAQTIVDEAACAGLVHFVDNAGEKIQHNCNCCGCACWNVGSIKRRKIPRDELMAVYFIRKTDPDNCIGCGECLDICPVNAVTLIDGDKLAKVDEDWCIGCGVCASKCSVGAIRVRYREDKDLSVLPDFNSLYERIEQERELS
ncbi:MAG: 4Fe-4S binding protein [Desulfobacula sp.]|nr:4Fe-4S binding protein [Desulfobacula sp.]